MVERRAGRALSGTGDVFEECSIEIFLEPFLECIFGFLPHIEHGALSRQVKIYLDGVTLFTKVDVEVAEIQPFFIPL